jgi:hypothetical protein
MTTMALLTFLSCAAGGSPIQDADGGTDADMDVDVDADVDADADADADTDVDTDSDTDTDTDSDVDSGSDADADSDADTDSDSDSDSDSSIGDAPCTSDGEPALCAIAGCVCADGLVLCGRRCYAPEDVDACC